MDKMCVFVCCFDHRRAVAQPCVNGDRLLNGQWKMAKFDPAQTRNPQLIDTKFKTDD